MRLKNSSFQKEPSNDARQILSGSSRKRVIIMKAVYGTVRVASGASDGFPDKNGSTSSVSAGVGGAMREMLIGSAEAARSGLHWGQTTRGVEWSPMAAG